MPEKPSPADILTELGLQKVNLQLFEEYPPVVAIQNGESVLHEESHVMRVLIYADLICQKLMSEGIKVNRHAILSAIRIHDSFRRDEYANDEDHGMHAARYARSKKIFDGDNDEELILRLAQGHCMEDEIFRALFYVDELPLEDQILKDADALDRYRDAHHDKVDGDGPDPDYFRLDITHRLMPVAETLCREYFDPHRSRQKDATADLISVGQNLGIIEQAV